jgi:hypothetical protein
MAGRGLRLRMARWMGSENDTISIIRDSIPSGREPETGYGALRRRHLFFDIGPIIEEHDMNESKISAERWPRTFRDLMAKTRGDVSRSRFVSSEHRRAGVEEDEENLESVRDELKTLMRSLDLVGISSRNGAEVDIDDLKTAVAEVNYALDELNQVVGYENQKKLLKKMDLDLAQIVREAHEEYRQWEQDQSRHRMKNRYLGDKAKELMRDLKGIRI